MLGLFDLYASCTEEELSLPVGRHWLQCISQTCTLSTDYSSHTHGDGRALVSPGAKEIFGERLCDSA